MKSLFLSLAFVAVLFCGCSKNVPMSGTVTFSDDGSPVPCGTVCFETAKFYARGELDEQGHYVLGMAKAGEGLPPGEYKICVTGAQVPDGEVETQGSTDTTYKRTVYKDLVDKKFTASKTSGITCNVDKSTKTFDFQVDRAK